MSFFQKLCSALFPLVSCPFPELRLGLQCCLYSLLEGQPENSWSLGGKYCIISTPSSYSGLHPPCFTTCVKSAFLSEPARAGDRHTRPSVGICSKAIGLPGTMFATLGVRPTGHLGPKPYQPSPKVINIPRDQISTPLLWNIWSVVSYQFVLKPLIILLQLGPCPL